MGLTSVTSHASVSHWYSGWTGKIVREGVTREDPSSHGLTGRRSVALEDLRLRSLLVVVGLSAAFGIALVAQGGPVATPPGAPETQADAAGVFVEQVWLGLALGLLVVGAVALRRARLGEVMVLMAGIAVWIGVPTLQHPLGGLMIVSLPLASGLVAAAGLGWLGTATLPIVAGGATVMLASGVASGALHWSDARGITALGCILLGASRGYREIARLSNQAREDIAEQRRLGLSPSISSTVLDRLVPGRAARRLTAVERARSQLATELHAEVMPRLLAAQRDAERTGADRLVPQIQDAGDALRLIMSRERPISLERAGFRAALWGLCDEISARHGVPIALEGECGADPPELVARATYRAVQEWLENLCRHGAPSVVRVMISVDARRVLVVVADDGAPLNPDRPTRTGHLGASVIAANAEAIGATTLIRREGGWNQLEWTWRR